MNDSRSNQALLKALAAARLKADPLVSIVEILGEWVLNCRSFEEVTAVLEGRRAAGDQAGNSIHPMSHSDSVRAVEISRRLWAMMRTMSRPRSAFAGLRLLHARVPRVGRPLRAGGTRRAAVRTGPPGSSENGDPAPGEAGPHSHKLEKLETAKPRQRRLDVVIGKSGTELHETASGLRRNRAAPNRPGALSVNPEKRLRSGNEFVLTASFEA